MSTDSRAVVRRAFADVLARAGWPAHRVAAFDRAVADLDDVALRFPSGLPDAGTTEAYRFARARRRIESLMELYEWHRSGLPR